MCSRSTEVCRDKDDKLRAEQAAECGDKGLATHLETIVEDETTHYEATEKILRGW